MRFSSLTIFFREAEYTYDFMVIEGTYAKLNISLRRRTPGRIFTISIKMK